MNPSESTERGKRQTILLVTQGTEYLGRQLLGS